MRRLAIKTSARVGLMLELESESETELELELWFGLASLLVLSTVQIL
jgi:hypothetical protein